MGNTGIEGVDFSAHNPGRPGSAALNAAGKAFVCTYLVGGNDWRALSRAEADELIAGGIELVANYEADVRTWEGGFAVGAQHAHAAQVDLVRLGLPQHMPIYFSVDDDVTPEDQAAIDDYLHGAASVIGPDRVGIYGGYWPVKRAFENGSARWLWQTYAWSGGNIHPEAHIYQYEIYNQYVNGVNVDLNRALKAHYGQASDFRTPPPPPTTPPPVYPGARIPAPDKIESQGHPLTMNADFRFRCVHGGQFHTAPAKAAPVPTPSPYKAGKTYTFPFVATVDGADWLVSRAGSWAHAKNFVSEGTK